MYYISAGQDAGQNVPDFPFPIRPPDRWFQRARTSFGACYRPNSHCGPEGGVYRSIPSLPQADQTLRPSGLQHPLIDQTRLLSLVTTGCKPHCLCMVEHRVLAMRCAGRRADYRIIVYPVFPANDGDSDDHMLPTPQVTLVLKKYSARWRGPHSPSIMCFSDCPSYLDAHR